jgi:hypothetical protein
VIIGVRLYYLGNATALRNPSPPLDYRGVLTKHVFTKGVLSLYMDVFVGVFWWGMTMGVGNAMLMRDGACVAELCLMGVEVCFSLS